MKESITIKMLSEALRKFALQGDVTTKDTQLMIYTDDNVHCVPSYKLLYGYKPSRNIPFSDVYDGNKEIFSFVERSALSLLGNSLNDSVSEFIAKLMGGLAKKHSVNPSDVEVMIWTRDINASVLSFNVYITTYENSKKSKTDKGKITLKEFLND